MKNMRLLIALIFFSIAFSGCAVVETAMPSGALPEAKTAYLTGAFSRGKVAGFALIAVDVKSGAEFAISLGANSLLPTAVDHQVVAIKLPPGRYSIAKWVTFGTLTKEIILRSVVKNPYLSAPFDVQAGTVVYMGNFDIDSSYSSLRHSYSITPKPVSIQDARTKFLATYTSFSENKFKCLMCIDAQSNHTLDPMAVNPVPGS
ncbi:hypothetical protein [Massilia glaciei]|uniref:DUF2846 domain-containing protein n=1 Tax=Massilia glaciei TaxID=1524097 RepID=A0A2U2HHW1_9BURK|nr:hypothetical protein [Massilia glaciei]PWF45511.1 hypothetical protein C7C56_017385 [Massilia glaciei]